MGLHPCGDAPDDLHKICMRRGALCMGTSLLGTPRRAMPHLRACLSSAAGGSTGLGQCEASGVCQSWMSRRHPAACRNTPPSSHTGRPAVKGCLERRPAHHVVA
eukprot:365023-Chlamydomonas_euryale.AAC.4